MQQGTTAPSMAVGLKPLVATLLGIPAALIVVAAANGRAAPIVGDGAGALVVLLILGVMMCSLGGGAMYARFGVTGPAIIGAPLGVLIVGLFLSGLFGWTLLLDPIVDALGGPESVTLVQAAIVAIGAVMILKWAIGWLSYLPRLRSATS
jgi:hypothetical protein